MNEQRKRKLLEAAERAMAAHRARPPHERVEALKRIGILDETACSPRATADRGR